MSTKLTADRSRADLRRITRIAVSAVLAGALLAPTTPWAAPASAENTPRMASTDLLSRFPSDAAGIHWVDKSTNPILPYSSLPNPEKAAAATTQHERAVWNILDAVLPVCAEVTATVCLQSVESRVGDGPWQQGTVLPPHGQRWFDQHGSHIGKPTGTWDEDASKSLPPGGEARLWQLAEPHGGGNTYLVSAQLTGYPESSQSTATTIRRMQLTIRPVKVTTNDYFGCGEGMVEPLTPTPPFSPTVGNCYHTYLFPTDMEIRMAVRLGFAAKALSGWLDGRLTDPAFTYDPATTVLTVSGAPMVVSRAITEVIPQNQIDSDPVLCEAFGCKNEGGIQEYRQRMADPTSPRYPYVIGWNANSSYSVERFEQLRDRVQEKADAQDTVWQVSSMEEATVASCPAISGFTGIVSTNASVYSPGPPIWNRDTGSLDFKVGSPHLDPAGKVFEGQYVLMLKPELAACLWGKNYAKGSASLSVVYAEGEQKIATAVLGERDGWVQFRAFGFHYSVPTLRATITVPPAEVPSGPTKPSVKPKKKTTTITCVKGTGAKQVVRKVKAVKPTCPAGFRKTS